MVQCTAHPFSRQLHISIKLCSFSRLSQKFQKRYFVLDQQRMMYFEKPTVWCAILQGVVQPHTHPVIREGLGGRLDLCKMSIMQN